GCSSCTVTVPPVPAYTWLPAAGVKLGVVLMYTRHSAGLCHATDTDVMPVVMLMPDGAAGAGSVTSSSAAGPYSPLMLLRRTLARMVRWPPAARFSLSW